MSGMFYNFGRFLHSQSEKAKWVYRHMTGDEVRAAEAEVEVGRELARTVLQESKQDPSPEVAQWIEEIGNLIVERVGQPHRTFLFRSLLIPEINAFALPGGFVFVSRRLLKLCEGSHDKLAFVLAHEVAHVVAGHAIERMLTQSLIGTATSRANPLGGVLRVSVGKLFSHLLEKGYSREQELEADRLALQWVKMSGLDPTQSPQLLAEIQAATVGAPSGGYFGSHPDWKTRIEHLRKLL